MENYWQGALVTLRAMEQGDIALFEGMSDEDARCYDELAFPRSRGQLAAWFERQLQGRIGDEFRWIAVDRDGAAVGTIETFAANRRNRTFKYGLVVAAPFRGKGYAADMIVKVLDYYFMELGYEKVTPHVYAFNSRSIHLHEKLGFRQEGRLRNMVYARGAYHDELHFGMTRDEFMKHYYANREEC